MKENNQEIIGVKNLTKKFKKFTAVDSIDFSVKKGEVFAFLGPNGAGKTTTIRMLTTLLPQTSGKIEVNGLDPVKEQNKVRASFGIVFQDFSLDNELTALENLRFHSALYSVPKKLSEERIEYMLKLVDLWDRKDNFVKTFSGGMKRRLEIARGLLHEPEILFLDEPTLGLDPQTRNKLWGYIQKLNEDNGLTIILTTHYMEEADKLSDRIAIIDKGTIITLDTPDNLKKELGGDIVTIETQKSEMFEQLLKKEAWCKSVKRHNHSVTINVKDAGKIISEIIKLAHNNNLIIDSANIHKPSLEDVFLYFTGKTIREQEADSKDAMRNRMKMWRKR